jgi:glycolate oxidase FAD binding subunit
MPEATMHVPAPWLSSLTALLEPGQIDVEPAHLQAHAVDGRVPRAVVFPETFEQTAAILHWAQSEKRAVLPRGAGTQMSLGGIPQRADLVLSTQRLRRISEYDAANFTVTAQAGVPFAAVARLAADNLQTLPLRYPFSAATLGGLIATNADSPKRLVYGGVRDLLLGLRVALTNGAVAHFGGKVVKNVAGYDMAKLFVGSLGTLGVIVAATFRLYALPERDETVLAVFPTGSQACGAAMQLLSTQLLPSQILVLNAAAAAEVAPQARPALAEGGAAMLVNVEGMDEAVERQRRDIGALCRGHGAAAVEVVAGKPQAQLRQSLAALTQAPADELSRPPGAAARPGWESGAGTLIVRLGSLPSRVPAVMEAVAQTLTPVAPRALIVGDAGVGQVRVIVRGGAAEAVTEALVQALHDLPRLVAAEAGYVVVEAAPTALKEQLAVWGPPPPSFGVLKALKAKFDPAGILNPGRFIGGL